MIFCCFPSEGCIVQFLKNHWHLQRVVPEGTTKANEISG